MIADGWIGVDLDGTLAKYHGWVSESHIGEPVPAMLAKVKAWIADGQDVRIFTARVSNGGVSLAFIEAWCLKHVGRVLPVTNVKDFGMRVLYDDRAVRIIENTGEPCCGAA